MRIEELKGKTIKEARAELELHTVSELKTICRENGVKGYSGATKNKLIDKVISSAQEMWLLKLGVAHIDGNNVWEEYADGTMEVVCGEIPVTKQGGKTMIKTAEELRVKLEGKTERSEIEAVLNGATVGTLKLYVKEEGFDCTGYHTWKKADFVETIAVGLMEDIAKEHRESHVPDKPPAPVRRQHTMRVIRLANKYAEARGTVEAILTALKIFCKGRKVRASQGLAIDGFDDAIKGMREKYREWRVEAFKLRRKLLRVMSAGEIRLACEAYTARCEEIRRGHLARK